MKRTSLQGKLTLWFSAALILMAALTFVVVFFVSHSVLQKQLRTELIHTVEDNVDEVEFYRSVTQMELDGGTDHYIRIRCTSTSKLGNNNEFMIDYLEIVPKSVYAVDGDGEMEDDL